MPMNVNGGAWRVARRDFATVARIINAWRYMAPARNTKEVQVDLPAMVLTNTIPCILCGNALKVQCTACNVTWQLENVCNTYTDSVGSSYSEEVIKFVGKRRRSAVKSGDPNT